ncbi:MAG: class I SAM-dependent methyltransferase [Gammaproteobacteria bacterium]|nr:class I SAM-dependent methyltransferase [Gammaproteobacteria bacterium]
MNIEKLGDYTNLADNYSAYRPGYSESVLAALFSLLEKPAPGVDFADVGAGTGIWTRMVCSRSVKSAIAVEPNEEMRSKGIADCAGLPVRWYKGKGEDTGLESDSVDFLTMASSFHWVDFDAGVKEFSRVLRKGGRFAALWNPRLIEENPVLVEIENTLHEMVPELKRVSSGRSGLTTTLTQKLNESPFFDDVVYIEGRHTVTQTPEQYLGAWWSVNDIRVQAGEDRFNAFMAYVEKFVGHMDGIETTYLTRAWSARTV